MSLMFANVVVVVVVSNGVMQLIMRILKLTLNTDESGRCEKDGWNVLSHLSISILLSPEGLGALASGVTAFVRSINRAT